jgi:hypothetical protein
MKRLSIVLLVSCLTLMPDVHAAKRAETQKEVAERIALDGKRAADRGDARGAKDAQTASDKARRSKTVEQARQIEKNYNKDNFN